MAIKRTHKTKNFTTVNNGMVQNPKLSLKAKGLMTYLLSMPDSWNFRLNELARHSKDGLDAHRAAMKELMDARYVFRVVRERKSGGTFGDWIYDVFEEPLPVEVDAKAYLQEPYIGSTYIGKTYVGEPNAINNVPDKILTLEKTELKKPLCSLSGGETFSDFSKWDSEAGDRVLSLMPGDLIPEISKIPDSKGITRMKKAEAMMGTGLYPVLCAMVGYGINDPAELVPAYNKIRLGTWKPGDMLTMAVAMLTSGLPPRESIVAILSDFKEDGWPYLEECRSALKSRMRARLEARHFVRNYFVIYPDINSDTGRCTDAWLDTVNRFGQYIASELLDIGWVESVDHELDRVRADLAYNVHELWKRAKESGLKATTAREWFEAVAAMFPDGQVRPVISLIAAVGAGVQGLKAYLAGNAAMRERILLDLARSQAHRDALSKRCGSEEAMLDMLSIHPGIFKELIDEEVDRVLEGV